MMSRKGYKKAMISGMTLAVVTAALMCVLGILPSFNVYAEEGENAAITVKTQEELVKAIESAENGVQTRIVVADYVEVQSTTTIPAGKDIVLVNDGEDRNIHPDHSKVPMPMFTVNGTLSIECRGDDSSFRINGEDQEGTSPGQSFSGKATAFNVNGTLNIKGGTIVGATVTGQRSGTILLQNGSTVNMTGGVIRGTIITEGNASRGSHDRDYTGAVVVLGNSTFNMSGGVIEGNKSNAKIAYSTATSTEPQASAGAIAVSSGTVNISGDAIIRNNESKLGGAIYMDSSTKVNISGGTFENNYASNKGGVAVVASPYAKLNITGGTFKGNSSYDGGAIWTWGYDTRISGGKFIDNEATRYGGAVALAEDGRSMITMKNAIIRNNSASLLGGGVWVCPSGSIVFDGKEGVAIYDNTSAGAGDDFVATPYYSGGYVPERNFQVYLSDTALAGQRIAWYQDGGVKGETWGLGSADPEVKRYDSEDPGDRVYAKGTIQGSLSLKGVVSDSTRTVYDSMAYNDGIVLFEGNSAGRGGAIGGNSNVVNTEEYKDPVEGEIEVTKSWDEEIAPEDIPDSITVELLLDDKVIDSLVISKDKEWKGTFNGIQIDALKAERYQVREVEMAGFTATYAVGTPAGEEDITGLVEITNHKKPEEVKEVFEDPEQPVSEEVKGVYVEPEKKQVKAQVKPAESNPTKTAVTTEKSADTGDRGMLLPAMVLMAVAGLIILYIRRRKKLT